MKHPFLVLTLTACTAATTVAQTAADKASENVVMKKGTFWATFETSGKLYSQGNWIQPAFNFQNPEAVSAAIANLPTQRENPDAFNLSLQTLYSALEQPNANTQEIQDALLSEFYNALASGQNRNADWSGTNFSSAYFGFQDADLTGVNFSNANLTTGEGTILWGANLSNSNVTGAIFTGLDCGYANFSYSNLTAEQYNSMAYASQPGLAGKDLTGYNFTGKFGGNWRGTPWDVSNTNVTIAQVLQTMAPMPDQWGGGEENILYTNFTGTNITPQSLLDAGISQETIDTMTFGP